MGIKRQKASAIMQSLLIDLAATGSFEALAIIKKAWTIESPLNNLQDALEELQDAEKAAKFLVATIDSATKKERIDANWAAAAAPMVDVIGEMIAGITRSIALIDGTSDYWNTTGVALLRDMFLRTNKLLAQVLSLEAAVTKEAGFGLGNFGKKDIAVRIRKLEITLIAARDEIVHAMEAAGIDPSAAPADAPADAPAAAPSADPSATSATSGGGSSNPSLAAYNRHILGGKKALEDFFTRYKVEADPKAYGFNRPAHEIVKKHILDNKDIKSLMIHADKHDKPESLKQLLNISKFAAAAEALRRAVDAQIKTASSELDALPPVLPGV